MSSHGMETLLDQFMSPLDKVCCVVGIMFNTSIGQHILKNPLVVNGIIEKVICTLIHTHLFYMI